MSTLDGSPTSNGHAPSDLRDYTFPTHALATTLGEKDKGRAPLVLCACGSFSPPTYLHLRMFEMAKDWARSNTQYTVIGAYLSPVGDAYKKKGLAPAKDRVNMCELALNTQAQRSRFVMVDTWEAKQKAYQPTAKVLDHFNHEINEKLGGIDDGTGKKVKVRISLVCGADLVETFSQPSVWSHIDLSHILCDYGCITIERSGTDLDDAISKLDPSWREHVHVIHQMIRNDVSSTKIRTFLENHQSIRYLLPEPVISYIEDNHLYQPATRELESEPWTPTPAPPNAVSKVAND